MTAKVKSSLYMAAATVLLSFILAPASFAQSDTSKADATPVPVEVIAPVFDIGTTSTQAVFVEFEDLGIGRAGTVIGPDMVVAPLHAAGKVDGSETVTIRHSGGIIYGRVVGEKEDLDIAFISAPSLGLDPKVKKARSMPQRGEPVNFVFRTSGGITSVPGTFSGQSGSVGTINLRRSMTSSQYGGVVVDACGYYLGTVGSTLRARDARKSEPIGNTLTFLSSQRIQGLQGYGISSAALPCPSRAEVQAQAKRINDARLKAIDDAQSAQDAKAADDAKQKADEAAKKKAEEDAKKAEAEAKEKAKLKRIAMTSAQKAKAAEEKAKAAEDAALAEKEAREAAEKIAAEKDDALKSTTQEKEDALKSAEEKKKQNYIIGGSALALIFLLALISWLLIRRQRKARTFAERDASNQRDYAENLKSHIPPNPYSDCLLYGDESLKLPGAQLPEAAGGVIIGRHPGQAQVVLDRTDISRNHARFYVRNNEVYLEDLGSTNGTYINTRRLAAGDKGVIQTGDYIKFGDHEFEFRKLNS